MSRVRRRAAAGLLVVVVALGPVELAGAAAAQDVPAAPATAISLTDLGRGAVALPTATTTQLVLPVPDGLTPVQLSGTVRLPLAATGAAISVTSGDVGLARLDVTDTGGTQVTVPLRDAPVVDRAVTLTLRSELRTSTETCVSTPDGPPTLDAGVLTYSGTEATPATPTTFFPPVLRAATVYLTDPSSAAQRDTALALSAGLVHRYGAARTQVRLAELTPGAPVPDAAPLERAVVLRSGPQTGVALEPTEAGTALRLSGDDTTLRDQARLLLRTLDDATAVTRTVPQLPADVVTLGDLAQSPLQATGRRHVELPVTVDATRIGRPLGSVRLHLLGSYTPQPSSYSGQVTATAGTTRLATAPLDGSGRLDLTVDVPADRLSRFLQVDLAVDLSGDFGCGTGSSTTLALDPTSTVTTTAGTPGPAGGFASLPQGLTPTVTVGLDGTSTADLDRAQQLLVAWQRLSAAPLDPTLTGVTAALDAATPALVVTPAGGLPDGTSLPLDDVDAPALAVRGLPAGAPRGSVQVAWDDAHSRTVVVAGSTGNPADLDAVLGWLAAEPTRVADLTGDVVVGSRSVPPVELTVRVGAPAAGASAAYATGGGLRTPLIAIGGAAVVLLGAALLLTVLWRRGRP
ncbi:membrane protein [Rhodococcus aerolatus]